MTRALRRNLTAKACKEAGQDVPDDGVRDALHVNLVPVMLGQEVAELNVIMPAALNSTGLRVSENR